MGLGEPPTAVVADWLTVGCTTSTSEVVESPPAQIDTSSAVPPASAGGLHRRPRGQLVAALSRRAVGQRVDHRQPVTLAMDPAALSGCRRGRVVLVSGNNGKTRPAHAAARWAASGRSRTRVGSNMATARWRPWPSARTPAGGAGGRRAAPGLGGPPGCSPTAIVLLNLTRDQLDRAAEVRRTAASIARRWAGLPDTTVFANADDP